MNANVGNLDRIIRIIVGVVILSLVFILPGSEKWWGLLGLLPLVTGLIRFCPAYTPFGINTCRVEHKPEQTGTHVEGHG